MQSKITVQSDILLNVLGVDDTAVLEGDTHLFGVEIGLAQRENLTVLMDSLRIQQILADAAVHDVLVNDALCGFGRRLGIEGTLGIDDHDGAQRAEAETSGLDDQDVLDIVLFELFFKRFNDL